jgi:hypothetical protein
MGRPDPATLLSNVFFDTCVYHQLGIDLLARVIPTENILFASEMLRAVRGAQFLPRSPELGHGTHPWALCPGFAAKV